MTLADMLCLAWWIRNTRSKPLKASSKTEISLKSSRSSFSPLSKLVITFRTELLASMRLDSEASKPRAVVGSILTPRYRSDHDLEVVVDLKKLGNYPGQLDMALNYGKSNGHFERSGNILLYRRSSPPMDCCVCLY